jgi:hypothetical protein
MRSSSVPQSAKAQGVALPAIALAPSLADPCSSRRTIYLEQGLIFKEEQQEKRNDVISPL